MQGDVIAFTNPLTDAAGASIGKLDVSCVTTTGSRNFMKSTLTCPGVVSLRDGTLTLQLNSKPRAPETTGAVTGGTGAYANARGVFVATATRTGATDTVTWTEQIVAGTGHAVEEDDPQLVIDAILDAVNEAG